MAGYLPVPLETAMFLIRLAFIAVFLVMLLPSGPDDNAEIFSMKEGAGFCDRYPKTCDASVELYTAFRQKLTYGVSRARQIIAPEIASRVSPTDRRFGEEAPGRYQDRVPERFRNNSDTFARQERGADLRSY